MEKNRNIETIEQELENVQAAQAAISEELSEVGEKLQAASGDAYPGVANTDQFVIFYNHYPPENAALGGRLVSDKREAVEVGR